MKNRAEISKQNRTFRLNLWLGGFLFYIFVLIVLLDSIPAGAVEHSLSLGKIASQSNPSCAGDGSSGSLACGLVGYWNFDDGSGTAALDTSGNGYNGTLINCSTTDSYGNCNAPAGQPAWITNTVPGNVAVGTGALSFSGSSKVDIGTLPALNTGTITTVSWSFWIKPTSISPSMSFISQYQNNNNSASSWKITSGQNEMGGPTNIIFWVPFVSNGITYAGEANTTSNIINTSEQWYHVVVIYNGSSTPPVQIWINGGSNYNPPKAEPVYVQGIPASIPAVSVVHANIGGTNNNTEFFNGAMDDVRIYNRVLTSADIQALYLLGKANIGAGNPPNSPTWSNPAYTNLQDTQVSLSWNAPTGTNGVTGYNIYRTDALGNSSLIATTTLTSYIDNFLVPGTNYSYNITAYNEAGQSSQSTSLSITTASDSFVRPSANDPPQTQPGEVCDATNVNGYSCATVTAGFTGGALSCKPDRSGYDISQCVPGRTIVAASCSQLDVQAAINYAINGDTIIVPAGTCAWTTPVVVGGQISAGNWLNAYTACPSTNPNCSNGTYIYHSNITVNGTPAQTSDTVVNGSTVTIVTDPAKNDQLWSIYPSKSIVLKGSGIGQTIILNQTKNVTYTNPGTNAVSTIYPQVALNFNTNAGLPVRVTDFTFDGSDTQASQFIISLSGPAYGVLFRVDHNDFVNLNAGGIGTNGIYGLVDHNTFIQATGADVTAVSISGDTDAAFGRPLSLGTENAVYIEDNLFNFNMDANGPEDAYVGARYVFRYNTVIGVTPGHHGFDSASRGVVSWELYNNRITTYNQSTGMPEAFQSRSGTGVFFNNLIPLDAGELNIMGSLINYRSSDGYLTNYGNTVPWNGSPWDGLCDGNSSLRVIVQSGGSGYQVGDMLQLNQTGASGASVTVTSIGSNGTITGLSVSDPGNGYTPNTEDATAPGLPVVLASGGHGSGAMIGIGLDGNTPGMFGYPCEDQNGRATIEDPDGNLTTQALVPVYAWNNNIKGTVGGLILFGPGGYADGECDPGTTQVTAPSVVAGEGYVDWTCTQLNNAPNLTYNDYEAIHIQEGKDIFNQSSAPSSYVPYSYPHPLAQMDAQTIIGNAAVPSYVLSVSSTGNGSGSLNVGSMFCGSSCSMMLNSGSSVTLTATANPGSTFTGWSGNCSLGKTANTCIVTVGASSTVTANFNAKGSVYLITDHSSYTAGASVILTATATAASGASIQQVAFYNGATLLGTSSSSPYTFTWNNVQAGDHFFTAVATDSHGNSVTSSTVNVPVNLYLPYTLNVSYAGNGMVYGSVGPSVVTPYSINCGVNSGATACSVMENSGTEITLSAIPATGAIFSGWSGACSGNGTCSILMNSSENVTATFNSSVVNGVCGAASKTYLYNVSGFGANALCRSGNPNPATVQFPGPGGIVRWTCEGINNGLSSTCKAQRNTKPIIKLL